LTVAVASPHVAATEAARGAVAAGGCAVDAAIAAVLTLTVVYPHQVSIGGDLIAMIRLASGETKAVISAGAAARGFDVEACYAQHANMPDRGPLTITVPGLVGGLSAVATLGARLPLAAPFGNAADLAENGVAVSLGLARALAEHARVLAQDPGAAAILLDDCGAPLVAGDRLAQPALAGTLRALAANPADFYTGAVAGVLADGLSRLGSPLTAIDLATHQADIAQPLQSEHAGVLFSVPPPPSQAVALLAVLGAQSEAALLERSIRVAAVRNAELADPRVTDVPVQAFFSAAFNDNGRLTGAPRPLGDTVAVTAVDSDGLAVTLVASVYHSFGSGLLEPNTGIVLHNRGSGFSLNRSHPGRLRPGARPPHTLSPVIAERTGSHPTLVALGCQGGRAQPWILAQVAEALVAEHTTDLAAVLGRPRWFFGSHDIGVAEPSFVTEDDSVPPAMAAVARTAGLAPVALGRRVDVAGHVQVARLDERGLSAAADPRSDGSAVVAGPGATQV
jgi:gamma-glutamyltranspeptidase